MIAAFIGLLFMAVGVLGLVFWFHEFLFLLRGFGPVSLFLGGLISLIAGIESLQTKRPRENKKE